ncbi:MAG: 3-phosphoshikimate 1-carboxyvinyltransferase [Spirochaetes bacterium]|nr:3-phosphoshikimate 1-carboxyvinyltransferase [Spirochaetota bacterium]
MNKFIFKNINGTISLPGDRSISHRALFLSALSTGKITITGLSVSPNVNSTIELLRQCHISVIRSGNCYTVKGNGLYGIKEPHNVLDAGNSGTTIRIASGILGPQRFYSVLTGDEAVRDNSIRRIVAPLEKMGIRIYCKSNNSFPPITILPCNKIRAISYKMAIPSARIKSALLFAGLYTKKEMIINEPFRSPDHTERIFQLFNIPVERKKNKIILNNKGKSFKGKNITIPGDFSFAAYFIVAALITPKSRISIKNVCLNETRIGLLNVLQRMGAKIEIKNMRKQCNEAVGDLTVQSSNLIGTEIKEKEIPLFKDELPILSIAATAAQGRTTFTGAQILRTKEYNRLKYITENLKGLGVPVKELNNGFVIKGESALNTKNVVRSFSDSRITMSFIIAATLLKNGIKIDDISSINNYYPDFINELRKAAK